MVFTVDYSILETNSKANNLIQHPELQLAKLTERIAHLDYQMAKFTLSPQISLFYNYNYNDYQLKQNTNEKNWGVKASFTPFDTAGKLSKQQIHTNWLNANYDSNAKNQQLQQQLLLKIVTGKSLQNQLQLIQQGVNLAQQAFNHAQARFDQGIDNALSVKQAQDTWLNQQKAELIAIKALLINQLDYYQVSGKIMPYNSFEY